MSFNPAIFLQQSLTVTKSLASRYDCFALRCASSVHTIVSRAERKEVWGNSEISQVEARTSLLDRNIVVGLFGKF